MVNYQCPAAFQLAAVLIRCLGMRCRNFFHKKVRLPLWPLIPLVIVGIVVAPHRSTYGSEIAGVYAALGLLVVGIRYWWAWIHGAPWFDWLILIALSLTMGLLANVFVSTVIRFTLK